MPACRFSSASSASRSAALPGGGAAASALALGGPSGGLLPLPNRGEARGPGVAPGKGVLRSQNTTCYDLTPAMLFSIAHTPLFSSWQGGSPLCGFYVSVCVTVWCYVAWCSTSYPRLSRYPSTPPAPPHRASPQRRLLAARPHRPGPRSRVRSRSHRCRGAPRPGQGRPPDPIPGWTPAKVKGGVWGARFQGDTRTLPADLDGLTISVIAKSGDSWIATVTEVVERSPDRLLVRTQRLGQ